MRSARLWDFEDGRQAPAGQTYVRFLQWPSDGIQQDLLTDVVAEGGFLDRRLPLFWHSRALLQMMAS